MYTVYCIGKTISNCMFKEVHAYSSNVVLKAIAFVVNHINKVLITTQHEVKKSGIRLRMTGLHHSGVSGLVVFAFVIILLVRVLL